MIIIALNNCDEASTVCRQMCNSNIIILLNFTKTFNYRVSYNFVDRVCVASCTIMVMFSIFYQLCSRPDHYRNFKLLH